MAGHRRRAGQPGRPARQPGEQEWETPSLCAGWRVRDVAAHLTLAHMGAFPAVVALARARGNFNRMVRDTAVRQAALPVREYAPRLRAMAGSRRKAPGVSHLEPLIDVLVHGQDIAIPLGRTRPMPARGRDGRRGPGLARPVPVAGRAEAERVPVRRHGLLLVGRGRAAGRGAHRGDLAAAHRAANAALAAAVGPGAADGWATRVGSAGTQYYETG